MTRAVGDQEHAARILFEESPGDAPKPSKSPRCRVLARVSTCKLPVMRWTSASSTIRMLRAVSSTRAAASWRS